MKSLHLTHVFIEEIPADMQQGILYVSMECATAIHRCACGCGAEVVTPLAPTDWSLLFDGETVSLNPSIGNWNLACRSHYWIKRDVVLWAGDMSPAGIERGREVDRRNKAGYFSAVKPVPGMKNVLNVPQEEDRDTSLPPKEPKKRGNLWSVFKEWVMKI